jgi:hypothetical protein
MVVKPTAEHTVRRSLVTGKSNAFVRLQWHAESFDCATNIARVVTEFSPGCPRGMHSINVAQSSMAAAAESDLPPASLTLIWWKLTEIKVRLALFCSHICKVFI